MLLRQHYITLRTGLRQRRRHRPSTCYDSYLAAAKKKQRPVPSGQDRPSTSIGKGGKRWQISRLADPLLRWDRHKGKADGFSGDFGLPATRLVGDDELRKPLGLLWTDAAPCLITYKSSASPSHMPDPRHATSSFRAVAQNASGNAATGIADLWAGGEGRRCGLERVHRGHDTWLCDGRRRERQPREGLFPSGGPHESQKL